MKFIDSQIAVLQARVMYWHAMVTSGAYRSIKTQRGCGRGDDGAIIFRDLTDEEKLDHCMGVLKNHLDRLQEFSDYIGEKEAA